MNAKEKKKFKTELDFFDKADEQQIDLTEMDWSDFTDDDDN